MDSRASPAPVQPPTGGGAVGAAAAAGTAVALAAWHWNADVPDPVAHRVFLAVLVLGGLLLAAEPLNREPRMPVRIPTGAHLFYLGLLAGTALGTTAWSQLDSVFWYQLWWAGPLATGLVAAIWDRRYGRPRFGGDAHTPAGPRSR
ncbi:hypothetical protein [Streptomonospora salina]|uniref:Uncharacterized protein n=1 Tax=Streptomonospora salina TaxID=104205 RepID=A0A841E760_9ACTN|nr:hypothetical protein [Streptomonospora salina]MBB5996988.1 hypothetical protein [Streptomonospora salina]